MTDQCDAAERDQARLGQQSQKMSAWGDQLANLVAALEELVDYFEKYTAAGLAGPVSLPEQQLRHLSDLFHKVCRVQHASLRTSVAVRPVFGPDAVSLARCACFKTWALDLLYWSLVWACCTAVQTLSSSVSILYHLVG